MSARTELSEQIRIIADMVEMNPCSMSDEALTSIGDALRTIIGREYRQFMTLEMVSIWLGVSVKTIERWQESRNFPRCKVKGKTGHLFYVADVVSWCRRNGIKPKEKS